MASGGDRYIDGWMVWQMADKLMLGTAEGEPKNAKNGGIL
jgi:hypothetical protein